MNEFDIRKLFENIWEKKVIIGIIIILFLLIGILYSFFIKKTIYTSKTRIILEKNDVSVSEYVKSDIVLVETINNLNRDDLTIDKLKSKLKVTYNKETRIIQILCEDADNNDAARIVTELTNVYLNKLEEVYQIKNAKLLEEARIQNMETNQNTIKDITLFLLTGIVVAGLYILIINSMESSLKTTEDIESLNMNVLGIVPNKEEGSEE